MEQNILTCIYRRDNNKDSEHMTQIITLHLSSSLTRLNKTILNVLTLCMIELFL